MTMKNQGCRYLNKVRRQRLKHQPSWWIGDATWAMTSLSDKENCQYKVQTHQYLGDFNHTTIQNFKNIPAKANQYFQVTISCFLFHIHPISSWDEKWQKKCLLSWEKTKESNEKTKQRRLRFYSHNEKRQKKVMRKENKGDWCSITRRGHA